MDTPCPSWIIDALRDGFRLLLSLSLEGTPSHATIANTAMGWARVIQAHGILDEQRDRPRFDVAFTSLAGTCRRWPAPIDFLTALPRLPTETRTRQHREIDAGERARVARHIAEIVRVLKQPPVPDEPPATGETKDAARTATPGC